MFKYMFVIERIVVLDDDPTSSAGWGTGWATSLKKINNHFINSFPLKVV